MTVEGINDIDGEETLEQIIWDIYVYLETQGAKRFHRFLGRRGGSPGASWTEINIQLSHFVKDPKNNYSRVIRTIENERMKFRDHPGYVDRLSTLEDFLKQSPRFSKDYNCLVRVPDGFKKRKLKSKVEPIE